jgi:iron complex outermembrane receptor protein
MWDDYDSDKSQYEDIINGRTGPFTSSDRSGDLMEKTDAKVNNYGIYAQEEFRPNEHIILNGGVRYDKVSYDVEETNFTSWKFNFRRGWSYVDDFSTSEADEDFSHVSPRIGITYLLTKTASMYGSVSTGFQTPTRGELITNLGLDPAETVNYEVGVKTFERRYSFTLALYYTDIENEIIEIPNPDGSDDTFFDNAGDSTHKGVEAAGSIVIIDGLTFGLAYTYSDFILDDYESSGEDFSGNRLPLVPKHQLSGSLKYKHPSGFSWKISSDYWGKYYVDEANSESYKGYTVVNARVAYDKDNLGLFVSADNIFDEEYATEVTKSRGTLKFSPAPPITWLAGVSYKF